MSTYVIENKGNKDRKISFMGTPEYRKALQMAALERDVDVQALIEKAIAAYLTSGTASIPELHENTPGLSKNEGLPEVPTSAMLSKAQLALYRELVEKLVRIIASGNAEALTILRGGVKTALNELPPDPPLEASPSERVPKPMPPTRARGDKSA